jgi:hypothetical protein
VNRSLHNYKDPIQLGPRRKGTVRLVVSQLISRESLNAMIGDGLARIIATHLAKDVLQAPHRQTEQQLGSKLSNKEAGT